MATLGTPISHGTGNVKEHSGLYTTMASSRSRIEPHTRPTVLQSECGALENVKAASELSSVWRGK